MWLYNYQLNPSLLRLFKKKIPLLIVVGNNSSVWIHTGFMDSWLPRLYFSHCLSVIWFFFFALKVLYTATSQELSYIVKELKPYRIYNFTISLCNSIGCVTSASGAGRTLAAGKQVLMDMKNILCLSKQTPIKLNTFSSLDLILIFSDFSCSPISNSDCYLYWHF